MQHLTRLCLLTLLATVVACGGDTKDTADGGPPDSASDATTDADSGGADADTSEDTEPGDDVDDDADPDVTDPDGGDPDADDTDDSADTDTDAGDDGPDEPAPLPCDDEGAVTCSEDAFDRLVCTGGFWTAEPCMLDRGLLCEDGACVEPWRYGSPTWSSCDDEPLATSESLVEKAAYYDDIAQRLHVHPELGWMMGVTLRTEEVECPDEVEGPCFAPVRGHDDATWEDVAQWHTGENDGLWSALYLASQAFRYAATEDADALAMIRLMLAAQVDRMEITGVPGVFTRQYIPPGIDGIACPTEDAAYRTDEEKDDNQWVQIREDGCVWVVDRHTDEWTQTDHCGFERFAGYCWLDNVSQDEYAGHMFALAALWLYVDDPDVRATAADLIEQVGVHLMENELALIDWDGRMTEHGKLYVTSFAGFPGFLASEALAFVRMAAVVSGRADLREFYEECLLQKSGLGRCMSWPLETGEPYHTQHLPQMGLYIGADGCRNNYNNHSMVMSYLWVLLQFETEPEIRRIVQDITDRQVVNADHPRAISTQRNAWYNVMWASMKPLGPDSDGPAFELVEQANCSMRQFAPTQVQVSLETPAEHPHFCEERLGGSHSEHVIPIAYRCPATFQWWRPPYARVSCTANDAVVRMPADYLLSYWMARFYGFLDADD